MGLEQELDELLLEGEYPAIDASDLVRGIKDGQSQVCPSGLSKNKTTHTLEMQK